MTIDISTLKWYYEIGGDGVKRFGVVVLVLFLLFSTCLGETETYWVMCNPDSFVFIREYPKKSSVEGGYLEYGDSVEVDGRKRNGYWHIEGLTTELGEGWVKGMYLVDEEPESPGEKTYVVVSKGRLAVRNGVNGKRTRWLKPGEEVVVYGMTSEWAVTNVGYVKVEYLEEVGE